jgi:hypothetical protein
VGLRRGSGQCGGASGLAADVPPYARCTKRAPRAGSPGHRSRRGFVEQHDLPQVGPPVLQAGRKASRSTPRGELLDARAHTPIPALEQRAPDNASPGSAGRRRGTVEVGGSSGKLARLPANCSTSVTGDSDREFPRHDYPPRNERSAQRHSLTGRRSSVPPARRRARPGWKRVTARHRAPPIGSAVTTAGREHGSLRERSGTSLERE